MAPTPNKVIAPKIPFSLFDKKSNIFNIATFFKNFYKVIINSKLTQH